MFDSADAITFAHADLATPSGDVRLLPVLERLVPLAGQPALALAPGRQLAADGGPWPYDQRAVLERQVEALAAAGLTALVGYELEFGVYLDDGSEPPTPAHLGPAYSPHALVAIDGFVADVLRGCAANGLELGQLHAEYGPAQVEMPLAATDPGYFAGAYGFWGVQNQEAPLRYVPGSSFLGEGNANVELKTSDASANPYLALAAVLAAGGAGIAEQLELPEPVQSDPGTWSAEDRAARAVVALPMTAEDQQAALTSSPRVTDALGPQLLGAFLAVRHSDAASAAHRPLDDVLTDLRWRY